MRRISLTAVVLLLPALGFADSPRELKRRLNAAVSAVDDAQDAVSRAGRGCRDAVSSDLDNVGDRLDGLRAKPKARSIRRVQQLLQNVAQAAPLSGCPYGVLESLQRAQDALEEARIAARPSQDEEDDDGEDQDQGQQPARGFASLQPLKVTVNSVFENEPAVRLQVPELTLAGLRGQTFYLGARFRSYEGEWSEWVTTQRWSVPRDPFTWKNPFNHFLRYSRLAEEDFSDGRFVAHVSVFDAQGNELAAREVTFRVRLPSLPPAPVVVPPVPPVVVARDCGTGPSDPGCGMARDGNWPMDSATFLGFLQSLRSNGNEMLRLDMANSVFQRQYLTAAQLGMTMDFFANEMLKLELAKRAAGHVVNPQHALGLAAKFANNMLSTAYTQLMSQQQVGQPGQPYQPPPPGQPYQPPPVVVRDCGTGQDPGCGLSRNGRWAMDAATYQGFMQSLRANANEFGKESICTTLFANNMLTAAQLGAVLDQFQNELTRMEVAKKAAPVLVNPQHALGFAAKWRNSLIGQEYTQLMASQRVAP